MSRARSSTSSGLIWDTAGDIVTNEHALTEADRRLVRIDGRETVRTLSVKGGRSARNAGVSGNSTKKYRLLQGGN